MIDSRATAAAPEARCIAVTLGAAGEGGRRNIERLDVYLRELLGLMTREPVVVACGAAAHAVCSRAGLDAI